MRMKAKILKANNTSIKSIQNYSKLDRGNRYMSEKQKNANVVSNVEKKNTSNDEVVVKSKIDKVLKEWRSWSIRK